MALTAARVLFVEHFEPNVLGWDTTNPYEDSMLSSFSLHIPDTSTDTADGMNASRQLINDSLEPFALPEPLLPTRQPIPPIHEMAPHGFPGDAAPLDVTMRDNVAFAPPTMSLRQQQSGKPQLPFILPATTIPTKRPGMTGTEPLSKKDEASMKRQKRLEKNREIAKNCRKRKKEKKEALEEEINHLREENNRMRIQLRDDTDDASRNEQRDNVLKQMRDEMERKNPEGVTRAMKQYMDDWVSFGQKRLMMAEFHLDQLKTLILPSQVTKMCMWAMQQGDEFFDERLNEIRYGGGIWNLLSSKMNLTPEQRKAILRSRTGTVQQQENVAEVLNIVDKIQKRMESSMSSMREQLKGIVNVLEPEQKIKFMSWIESIVKEPRSKESIFMILNSRISATDDGTTSSPEEDSA
ncbi:hypothetical protein BLSTO_02501 [Blastocystis sp. subtype 1]